MKNEEEKKFFKLDFVRETFTLAKINEDDVDLELYLKSYEELNRFFVLLGTIFGFVSSELNDKMGLLKEFLEKPDEAHHFKTVKSMVVYEKENILLEKKDYVSGSRTLLRLHRGLEFIQAFLKRINDLKDDEGTANACITAYNTTLGNHHTFLIRSGAKIAMRLLPSKHQLLTNVCGSEDCIKKAEEILPETLVIISDIYVRIQKIYQELDLLSLP